jgi:hypothetical protein
MFIEPLELWSLLHKWFRNFVGINLKELVCFSLQLNIGVFIDTKIIWKVRL